MLRVAINGYGRIGRNIIRALYENNFRKQISVVAINDLAPAETNLHLTQYDSVHGPFKEKVYLDEGQLCIQNDKIRLFEEKNPSRLPWQSLSVDIVLECTGLFNNRLSAEQHLKAGAKAVLISAPANDADAVIVYGVNEHNLSTATPIVSNASCTTNCLAPIVKVLNETYGIEQGSMTTIHAFTNDQQLHDAYHQDFYRARAATQSMIPTKTGAANAVGLVLPELQEKLTGMAVRVPCINVSLVDFHCFLAEETQRENINKTMQDASEGSMKNILYYNDKPLVSIDFNHNPASACFDATQTQVNGKWVKIMAWYDNEWGFSNRMLDTALTMQKRVLS